MHNVVISGTGLYTPANSISNEELVQSFNTYVAQFNADNADAIARGEVEALTESMPRSSKKPQASRAACHGQGGHP
jgi:beta-ketodecanoyl-[acyl-carrier-protein] synthase